MCSLPVARHSSATLGVELGRPVAQSFYENEWDRKPDFLGKAGLHVFKPVGRVFFATFASVVAIGLLLVLCSDYGARKVKPGLPSRRLSGNGDQSLRGLQDVCENPSGGLNPSSSHKRRNGTGQGSLSEPKMDTDEKEGPVFAQATTVVLNMEQREADAGHAVALGAQQQLHASNSAAVPIYSGAPRSRSADELAAASALIMLQTILPQDATAEHLTSSDRQLTQQHQAPAESPAAIEKQEAPNISAQPLDNSAGSSQASEGQLVCSECSFWKLPAVQKKATYKNYFNPSRFRTRIRGGRFWMIFHFKRITHLLSKESLSPQDMMKLLRLAESLVACLRKGDMVNALALRPSKALLSMAHHFLLLDVLVSALQLLEINAEGWWWQEAIARVPHYFPVSSSFAGQPQQRAFNQMVIAELNKATETLKKGCRPSNEELANLKKLLFFSCRSPRELVRSQWNTWTSAGKDACEGI